MLAFSVVVCSLAVSVPGLPLQRPHTAHRPPCGHAAVGCRRNEQSMNEGESQPFAAACANTHTAAATRLLRCRRQCHASRKGPWAHSPKRDPKLSGDVNLEGVFANVCRIKKSHKILKFKKPAHAQVQGARKIDQNAQGPATSSFIAPGLSGWWWTAAVA